MKKTEQIKRAHFIEYKRKSAVVILLIFTYFCGRNIPVAKLAHLSAGEYVLMTLSDHYYMIYGFFFFFLFWSLQNIKKENVIELIRFQTRRKYYQRENITFFFQLLLLIFCHMIIASIIAIINFGFTDQFTVNRKEEVYRNTVEVIVKFHDYFQNPIQAIIMVSIYMAIGFFFFYNILYYLDKIIGRWAVISGAVVIAISTMAGFGTELDQNLAEVFFFNNYFLLHHSLLLNGKWAVLLNIVISAGISCCLFHYTIRIYKKKEGYKVNRYLSNSMNVPFRITAAVLLGIMLLPILSVFFGQYNAADFFLYSISGFSAENIYLKEALFYVVYFMYPIIIINVFLENEKENKYNMVLFRYGSYEKWSHSIHTITARFLWRYSTLHVVLLMILSVMTFLLTAAKKSVWADELIKYYAISDTEMVSLIVLSIVLRGMELCILYKINQCVFELTKKTIAAFLITFSGYFFVVVKLVNPFWLPFGKSGMYEILELTAKKGFYEGIRVCILVDLVWLIGISCFQFGHRRWYHARSNQIKKHK